MKKDLLNAFLFLISSLFGLTKLVLWLLLLKFFKQQQFSISTLGLIMSAIDLVDQGFLSLMAYNHSMGIESIDYYRQPDSIYIQKSHFQ